jgi:hypothetical protein
MVGTPRGPTGLVTSAAETTTRRRLPHYYRVIDGRRHLNMSSEALLGDLARAK